MLLLDCISEICPCLWRVQPHISWHHLKNARHSGELFGRQWQTYLAKLCPKESISKHPAETDVCDQCWGSFSPCAAARIAVGLSSLLGFPSVTYGTRCLQAPKQMAMKIFLHGFRKFESRVVVLGIFLTAYVLLGLYHTLAFLSHVLTELLG